MPSSSRRLGGAETGPRAAYVESVGRRVGGQSGIANPGQSLHFITLNSAVENAFSVPGGYVYVTRQLMGLMDDEFGACLRARPRGRPRRRQPRPHPRAICAAQPARGLRPDHRCDLRLGSFRRAHRPLEARLAELLARPGISGRYAGAEIHDPGRVRSGRRGRGPRGAEPGRARSRRGCRARRTARRPNGPAPTP